MSGSDPIYPDLEYYLRKDIDALKLKIISFAETIVEQDRDRKRMSDGACKQCYPNKYYKDQIIEGFVCNYHKALAIVKEKDNEQ